MNMSENPYASPRSESLLPAVCNEQFYVVSISKLVVLSMATMGLYWLYWHYRQWAAWRACTGVRVVPWLRALFSIFFVYSLMRNVDIQLHIAGREFRWFPRTCAWLLIILGVLSVISPLLLPHQPALLLMLASLLQLLTLVVMIRVQRAVNRMAGDASGAGNSGYSWANGIWILIGVLNWILNIGETFSSPRAMVGI